MSVTGWPAGPRMAPAIARKRHIEDGSTPVHDAHGIPAHEEGRCQERVQLDAAPGRRLAPIRRGVTVERPERAEAREDERP